MRIVTTERHVSEKTSLMLESGDKIGYCADLDNNLIYTGNLRLWRTLLSLVLRNASSISFHFFRLVTKRIGRLLVQRWTKNAIIDESIIESQIQIVE